MIIDMLAEAAEPWHDDRGVAHPQRREDASDTGVRHDGVGRVHLFRQLVVGKKGNGLTHGPRWRR